MSYLGKVDMNDADIKHYSLTGSTLTTVNIGWVPASEQSLRVTINGVVQQGDTFSYSGANLTLGGPLVATDTLEVVGIESVGNIITPADNSVTTAKLADDSVTLAKMAGGTDGNLITYDASGDPAYVATGSATNVLTSNGAGAAPTFQAVAGGEDAVKVLSKAADYTILDTDVDSVGTLYVLVDASGGTRTITLPAPADYSGVAIKVVTTVDPGANSVVVDNSGGTELWTMYELGDFYEVISDGTNNKKVAGHTSIYGYIVAVTASTYAGTGGIVNMFDSSSSVQNNVGGFWDSSTDYRIEIPADFGTGVITMGAVMLGNGSISAAYYKNGANLYNPNAGEYASSGGRTILTSCAGSDTFNHMVKGTHAAVNYLFYGGGPPADATYGWFKIERYT